MSKDDTVYEVLMSVTGKARTEINEGMDLVADLNIDSPDALRLLVELEDRLGIEISDEDAAGLDTVNDILAYVRATG
jgi:acyl carrier protein